jgi:hypothetical protein
MFEDAIRRYYDALQPFQDDLRKAQETYWNTAHTKLKLRFENQEGGRLGPKKQYEQEYNELYKKAWSPDTDVPEIRTELEKLDKAKKEAIVVLDRAIAAIEVVENLPEKTPPTGRMKAFKVFLQKLDNVCSVTGDASLKLEVMKLQIEAKSTKDLSRATWKVALNLLALAILSVAKFITDLTVKLAKVKHAASDYVFGKEDIRAVKPKELLNQAKKLKKVGNTKEVGIDSWVKEVRDEAAQKKRMDILGVDQDQGRGVNRKPKGPGRSGGGYHEV